MAADASFPGAGGIGTSMAGGACGSTASPSPLASPGAFPAGAFPFAANRGAFLQQQQRPISRSRHSSTPTPLMRVVQTQEPFANGYSSPVMRGMGPLGGGAAAPWQLLPRAPFGDNLLQAGGLLPHASGAAPPPPAGCRSARNPSYASVGEQSDGGLQLPPQQHPFFVTPVSTARSASVTPTSQQQQQQSVSFLAASPLSATASSVYHQALASPFLAASGASSGDVVRRQSAPVQVPRSPKRDVEPVAYGQGVEVQIGEHRFVCRSVLGRGSYSEVWRADVISDLPNCQHREAALKEVRCTNQMELQQAVFESQVLLALERLAAARPSPAAPLRVPRCLSYKVDTMGDAYRVRTAMTVVPGESLDVFLQRRPPAGLKSPMEHVRRGAAVAAKLIGDIGPTLELLAPIAWHRDMNSHNILIDGYPDESDPSDASVGRATFWLIDFGLAIDSQKWVQQNTWKHEYIGGDSRYWPVSSWIMHLLGPDGFVGHDKLCQQYKMKLDIHGLGITALEVFCTLAFATSPFLEAENGYSPLPGSFKALLLAWQQYRDNVWQWWSEVYSVFSTGGDIAPVQAKLVEDSIIEQLVSLMTNLRDSLRACASELSDDEEGVLRLMLLIADMIDETSSVELSHIEGRLAKTLSTVLSPKTRPEEAWPMTLVTNGHARPSSPQRPRSPPHQDTQVVLPAGTGPASAEPLSPAIDLMDTMPVVPRLAEHAVLRQAVPRVQPPRQDVATMPVESPGAVAAASSVAIQPIGVAVRSTSPPRGPARPSVVMRASSPLRGTPLQAEGRPLSPVRVRSPVRVLSTSSEWLPRSDSVTRTPAMMPGLPAQWTGVALPSTSIPLVSSRVGAGATSEATLMSTRSNGQEVLSSRLAGHVTTPVPKTLAMSPLASEGNARSVEAVRPAMAAGMANGVNGVTRSQSLVNAPSVLSAAEGQVQPFAGRSPAFPFAVNRLQSGDLPQPRPYGYTQPFRQQSMGAEERQGVHSSFTASPRDAVFLNGRLLPDTRAIIQTTESSATVGVGMMTMAAASSSSASGSQVAANGFGTPVVPSAVLSGTRTAGMPSNGYVAQGLDQRMRTQVNDHEKLRCRIRSLEESLQKLERESTLRARQGMDKIGEKYSAVSSSRSTGRASTGGGPAAAAPALSASLAPRPYIIGQPAVPSVTRWSSAGNPGFALRGVNNGVMTPGRAF
eukprot:TRINITY_DN24878_c0_g1_i2.p1 TRINITY_DN24878_c0_g1~~TRINITY_DN24878_c0_g1_i2.p1  ORF type:complete len:1189 (-),score=211.02 TRINITY_DN24878_c0_g1_i2:49-3615(-)